MRGGSDIPARGQAERRREFVFPAQFTSSRNQRQTARREYMHFQYHLPVNLIFGCGTSAQTGAEARKYGTRPLVVTGRSSTKKSGLLDNVLDQLRQEGMTPVVFDEVSQNPLTTTAEKGAALARTNDCDMVIGLGGGSIMDAAKAMAFLAINEGDINDYVFNRRASTRALPIVLVPTTAGTGSEGNNFSVLTNPDNGDKKSLRTNAIYPSASIIDPALMVTMPKRLIATVGFDALTHNMEAYLSGLDQPLAEVQTLYAMRLLGDNLPRVYQDSCDLEAWEKVTLASTIGGMAIGMAGVAAAHALEHPASGLKDIVHGSGLAALTPEVTRRTLAYAPEKYREISLCLGGSGENDMLDVLHAFMEELDLVTTLGQQGLTHDDVDWMTENAFRVSEVSIRNHPVVFSRDDVRDIYHACI